MDVVERLLVDEENATYWTNSWTHTGLILDSYWTHTGLNVLDSPPSLSLLFLKFVSGTLLSNFTARSASEPYCEIGVCMVIGKLISSPFNVLSCLSLLPLSLSLYSSQLNSARKSLGDRKNRLSASLLQIKNRRKSTNKQQTEAPTTSLSPTTLTTPRTETEVTPPPPTPTKAIYNADMMTEIRESESENGKSINEKEDRSRSRRWCACQ